MTQKKNDKLYQKYLFWLATHDAEFLKKYSKIIYPGTYLNPEEAWLLDQAVTFYEEFGGPLDEEALAILLQDKKETDQFDKEFVLDLYERPAPEEPLRKFLLDYSDEYLRRRYSEVVVQDYADSLIAGGSAEDLLSILVDGVEELSRSSEGEPPFVANTDHVASFQLIADLFNVDGLSTGIQAVDDIMMGGLRNGELGVYLAPPGHGKSHWLTHIGQRGWSQNKNVLYFSFEMSEARVLQRYYSRFVDVDSNRLPFEDPMRMAVRMTKYETKHEITSKFIVKRYPDNGANVRELTACVKEFEADGTHIDLVIVDYADIVAPVKPTGDTKKDQTSVYKDLRNMAIELDIPIWTASQANRQALRKRRITIEHLADDFNKAKTADYIIAQCQTEDEKAVNEVRLYFAKCRYNGQGDEVLCDIDFSRSSFTENLTGSRVTVAKEAA
ncbi:MAG: AAA family ATPase [Dehalococcoidia bacterium]|nr:AAA family ATPase [Dehalococcoidia bacterium]